MSEKPRNQYLASGGLPPGWEVASSEVPFLQLRPDVQAELKDKFDSFVMLAKIALARILVLKNPGLLPGMVTFSPIPDIATLVVGRNVFIQNKKYNYTHYGFEIKMYATIMGSTDPAKQELAGALIEALRYDEGQPTVH